MQNLIRRIKEEGQNLGNGILKVDSFVNHQVDPRLMDEAGQEFARHFKDIGATKILTAEISGIAPAVFTGLHMNLPVVYARKRKPITMPDQVLLTLAPSHTKGRTVEQVVSHVDLFPTLVEAVGAKLTDEDADLPGISLWPATGGDERSRIGFAEYHAAGSKAGSFMLRDGNMKLIYHVGMPSQLFDLDKDPNELRDLIADGSGVETAKRLEAILRTICDPEDVDARAKAAQRAKADHWGGLDSILKEGTLVITPPPGIEPDLRPTE